MAAKKHNLEVGRYDLRLYWFVLLIHGPKILAPSSEIGASFPHIHISPRRDAQTFES
jgi:hypothetical protein